MDYFLRLDLFRGLFAKFRLLVYRRQPILLLPLLFLFGLNWQRKDKKIHPEYYRAHGLYVFSGLYGSGKTLSMVRYLKNDLLVQYPKMTVYSNFFIEGVDCQQLDSIDQIDEIYNKEGTVFCIDEAQLTFNSHDKGKDAFPWAMVSAITQNRKEGKVMLFSAQHFYHMNKQIRDLCFRIIHCNSYLGLYFRNKWYDSDGYENAFNPDVDKRPWSLRTDRFIGYPELYNAFSTYKKLGKLTFDQEKQNFRGESRP